MAYDPRSSVAAFISKRGEAGHTVLLTWNAVDPLRCYYGEDSNPDEYLGYAERFIAEIERSVIALNNPVKQTAWDTLIRECVRRAFYPTQIAEGWVEIAAIERIAEAIHSACAEYLSQNGKTLRPDALLA